jgi:hypothetical protein
VYPPLLVFPFWKKALTFCEFGRILSRVAQGNARAGNDEVQTSESVASYPLPLSCPTCGSGLLVTRLQCPSCATEVSGSFTHPGAAGPDGSDAGRLLNLPEPYASLLELFLRVRGNVKDVERELGLSYPTVRARLDEAFRAAQPKLSPQPPPAPPSHAEREVILSALERGELTAAEATKRLREQHRS